MIRSNIARHVQHKNMRASRVCKKIGQRPALHRNVEYEDLFLLYFPDEQRAYATLRYDQW